MIIMLKIVLMIISRLTWHVSKIFEESMCLDCIGNLIILNAHMMKSTPTYSKIADILKQGKNSRIANI